MAYFSETNPTTRLSGLGCGPQCSCGPCSLGKSGLGEWYEKEGDEPEAPPLRAQNAAAAPPASGAASPSQNGNRLNGWNRSSPGLGSYGHGGVGFFSQAQAPVGLVYPQVNAQFPASGLGFYTYYATDRRGRLDNPPGYHRYGLTEVIRAVESIAAEWHRLHGQGPRLGIGDISLLGGGPTPRHGAHQRGLEVDIRPPRSDARELPATFNDPNYSRTLTQELVEVIRRNPILRVRTILFNDTAVQGVQPYQGHSDHLHVGFHPPAPAAASTQPGRPPATDRVAVGPRLDPHNKLAGVHPELARRIIQTAAALVSRGIAVTITRGGGLRTFAEQDAIYAQGRTRPGSIVTHARGGLSNHNYGLAVDLVPVVNGQPTWQVAHSVWQAVGDEGKRTGLSWGGDWRTFQDNPHLELPVGLSVQECLRIYNQGGLPAVWAEASRRLGTR